MKLTKEVVEVLKYHGYMTFTESTETFLKRFDTVENLGAAGFITDRGAISFLESIFDENGINRSAEVGEVELEKQAFWDDAPLGGDNNGNLVHIEDIEPDPEDQETVKVEDTEPDEGVNEQGPSGDVVDEQGPSGDVVDENHTEDKKEEESTPEPTVEVDKEETKVEESELEKVSEAVEQPAEVKPKPKKTTTRKSTKKES